MRNIPISLTNMTITLNIYYIYIINYYEQTFKMYI